MAPVEETEAQRTKPPQVAPESVRIGPFVALS